MKERPIIFNGDMVRAILEGRKTQTRRVIKPQPVFNSMFNEWRTEKNRVAYDTGELIFDSFLDGCPYGQPGDELWVRETWQHCFAQDNVPIEKTIIYKADCPNYDATPCKPSIHMPRCFSRIQLKITDVRVERVQDIADEDIKAEGIREFTKDGNVMKYGLEGWVWQTMPRTPRDAFKELWDLINAKRGYSWDANPWVWAIEFERVEP